MTPDLNSRLYVCEGCYQVGLLVDARDHALLTGHAWHLMPEDDAHPQRLYWHEAGACGRCGLSAPTHTGPEECKAAEDRRIIAFCDRHDCGWP